MITSDDPTTLERGDEKTCDWIEDTAIELGTTDQREAYATLKAVLRAMRDAMTVEGAAHLAAELPERLRWAFYKGWVPSSVPMTYHARDEFLRRVEEEAGLAGRTEASYAAASVMEVLERHLSPGEVDEALGALPGQVRCLLELRVR